MTSELVSTTKRILIIDDDSNWCDTLSVYATVLGYTSKFARNFEDAQIALREAENDGKPFSIATIDMRFELGEKRTEVSLGTCILQFIKSQYPYVACIMVTGAPEVANRSLELRDDYSLDSYISKDRLDVDTFDKAIARALKRTGSLRGSEVVEATGTGGHHTEQVPHRLPGVEEPRFGAASLATSYDTAAVHDLLLSAFSPEDLRRLFAYAGLAELRLALHDFAVDDGLATLADKAIQFCQTRDLLPDLLAEVERLRPRQYARHRDRLRG